MVSAAVQDRFSAKVTQTETCWLWTGVRSSNGYGQFHLDGRMRQAHRVAFELANGPLANGLEVDHLCHVRHCVNPGHLRAVSHAENGQNLRGAYRTSASGVRGVTWRKRNRKYQVQVQVNGRVRHIGYFPTLESAERAAIEARERVFVVPGGSR